ncbi:phosphoesterase RecJ-like protein [Anaerobacterium chartisolvens]|uniref:Phosphoesterase RecJ-like protein n=1 Tax=Anaerobacterium chartisolvens TaxID=1297424 RepID=A0A369AT16_9FIRM|nr:bifunctional oligoribonuclease/PAP phosphatase NrnA [Anaerobacterium chartisolvens]RCX11406.1 phosphoesterase RecJ-like protein [Anaerobacterium chartisolvens]
MLEKIAAALRAAKSIAVMPHISVDGDGLGSSLALCMALVNMGREAVVYLEEEIPAMYEFLPGRSMVKVYDGNVKHFDVVAALDTGDIKRLGSRAKLLEVGSVTVNIDHHNTNSGFALLNYVDTEASAVGEIIYNMISLLKQSIDSSIATCLYTAISTDTGGFRFSNTTALTHRIAADLVDKGVNVSEISRRVFELTSIGKARLTGEAIKALELFDNGRVAVIVIKDDMIARSGAVEEDCEGIVNIGRSIKGVEVAAMIREKGNRQVKVNLRSNGDTDVSEIASAFSGGGHKRAAGFVAKAEVEHLKIELLGHIEKALKSN